MLLLVAGLAAQLLNLGPGFFAEAHTLFTPFPYLEFNRKPLSFQYISPRRTADPLETGQYNSVSGYTKGCFTECIHSYGVSLNQIINA
jgi:hypothetical protein